MYLDHASATPVLRESIRATAAAQDFFSNPSAIHTDGSAAKHILEKSRGRIAKELGCKPRQIVFTSGLTESNNLGILGVARKILLGQDSLKGTHWVVSAIEHDSVLECFAEIERLGGAVSHALPDERGIITEEEIQRHLRPETVLVSVGWANNEIGVVQPLRAIAQVLRAKSGNVKRILLHSDAGQGLLYLFPHVHTLGADLFSMGAGKLYGPRGVGALYVSDPEYVAGVMLGGSQERGLRAGTEEIALPAGFAAALEVVSRERNKEAARIVELRDFLFRECSARITGLVVNGDLKHALPHMLNISIPHVSAEYVVLSLDRAGISISTKSACREGESSSHVVAALETSSSGSSDENWRARNTLRFSLGRGTTRSHVAAVAEALERVIQDYPHFAKIGDK